MDLCGCQVYSLCMSESLGHMSCWCRHFLKSMLLSSSFFLCVRHQLVVEEEGEGGGGGGVYSSVLFTVRGDWLVCLFFVVCFPCRVASWLNDSCAVPLTFSSLLFVSPLCLSVSLTLPVVFLSSSL